MKRLITILAALILVSGAAFAGDFYNGDVQFQLGISKNSTKLQNFDKNITAKEGVFGFQTWHLFKPVDLVGVGFMGGFNVGVGTTDQLDLYNPSNGQSEKSNVDGVSYSYNFEIGPAVGIYLGKIVRFGANICYTAGFNYDIPYTKNNLRTIVWTEYKGLSAGLQAKFIPDKKCNPIVGWKLVKGFSDNYSIISQGTESQRNENYDFTQNIFYAGLGISW